MKGDQGQQELLQHQIGYHDLPSIIHMTKPIITIFKYKISPNQQLECLIFLFMDDKIATEIEFCNNKIYRG